MITLAQLQAAVLDYAEKEILTKVHDWRKWALGGMLMLLAGNIEVLHAQLMGNPLVGALGLMDESGMIDSDELYKALKAAASKYGDITQPLPLVGEFKFSAADIDALFKNMKETGK